MTNTIEWTEKYRPKSLGEIVGNKKALEELRRWAEGVKSGEGKKAIILYGPPGCGKTSAAHALANEYGWEVIELNASDQRNEEVIRSVVGPASASESFSKTTRLIILDEADNIHGKEDRGGVRAITRLIRETSMPIILIANDLYKVGRGLRQNCPQIRFYRLKENSVLQILKKICDVEGVNIKEDVLRILAKNSNGDLRSAINDLQAICTGREGKEIEMEDIAVGKRDLETSIFLTLDKIFRGYDMEEALSSVYDLDMTPEDIIKWIYANLDIYDDESAAYSLYYLSRADEFLARAKKNENYTFWRYAACMMSCGVLSAKMRGREEGLIGGYYKYTSPWSQKGLGLEGKELRERIIKKIARYCKIPQRYARFFIFPLVKIAFKDEKKAIDIATSLRLEMEEIKFLVGNVEGCEEKAKRIYEMGMVRTKAQVAMEKDEREKKEIGEKEVGEEEKGETKTQKTLSDFFA
ncbi:MAG: replication factor C large subunit [Candidatus Methanospirareceae archaeon]